MKKRNTTIFAFLLLAAIGMGVGYAALSDDLNVNVNVGAAAAGDEWKENIHFDDTLKGNEKVAVTYDNDKDIATLDVVDGVFVAMDDEVTVELCIVNDNEYDAVISDLSSVFTAKNNDTLDSDFSVVMGIKDGDVIEAHSTLTFEVTIKLTVQPTADLSASFVFGFNAVSDDDARNNA